MRSVKEFFVAAWDTLEVILISLVTVFIIRTYLVQPFLVRGASMEPNFSDGNYLLIDEITHRFRDPQRGESIVFRYPQDRGTFFIKRIIGLPGERVFIKNNQIIINGVVLGEDYLSSDIKTSGHVDVVLGADEYFVLGDNRYNSYDSRNWGPLEKENITGIVRLRILPLNKFKVFEY